MAEFSLFQALSNTSEEEEEGGEEEEQQYSPRQTINTPVMLSKTSSASGPSSKLRASTTHVTKTPSSCSDMSTIPTPGGSGRKPRGRPPGSKNRPKPPIYIAKETESSVKTQQLEIPSGLDIVEMVQRFCTQNQVGVNVINGFGSVNNVMLRHPVIPGQSLTLSGTFDLLSVSGIFLGSSTCNSIEKSARGSPCLSVFFAGNGGQVFGGTVMGKVMAASNVLLNVSTFTNYEFHRLSPTEFDEADNEFDGKPNHNIGPRTEASTLVAYGGSGGGGGSCPDPTPISSHVPDASNWARTARPPHF
ncbi:hypothetical protein Nepgr_013290 [Nepenthes gracilis]|uniref:PPC domain-containing protein n=1 Tax=Nepenthes gracilis TaxID=150966 RepID=A0AAD3SIY1_NEPGR|nr:hypothetical protein Nepgr_013290 [Nepenthes gracilis]